VLLDGQVKKTPSAYPSPAIHTPPDTPVLLVLLVLVGGIIQGPAGQDGILSEYGRSQCWIGYQLGIGVGVPLGRAEVVRVSSNCRHADGDQHGVLRWDLSR
jgi:hypothetical protein